MSYNYFKWSLDQENIIFHDTSPLKLGATPISHGIMGNFVLFLANSYKIYKTTE